MQTARNVLIIALLALVVAVVPGGDDAADTVLTALTMCFLAVIAWFVYRAYRENRMTLDSLSDGRRAVLYGALGGIALLIAGADELFETGGGTLAWFALIAACGLAIFRVWRDATSYV